MNASSTDALYRSYVISWNLTRKCNLRCEHCYISAGRIGRDEAQGELSTDEALGVVDQLAEVNPEALLILTGGEPLLRKDVFEIASYADSKGLWPVIGTNGVLVTHDLCDRIIESGIKGMALSLDALSAEVHDRFRKVQGAFDNTVAGSKVLDEMGLPFIIQTTVGAHNHHQLKEIAGLAFELGARVFNVYFLVPTGRGSYITDISPEAYTQTLDEISELQIDYKGRMLINSKCAPHYQRMLYEKDPESPFLKSFSGGAGGCPAGTHYVGIRPNGDVTPCPYLPAYGGNLRDLSFREIWEDSEIFNKIRVRTNLGGRCGSCEFGGVCGGCRARALGIHGDFMAEDDWCNYEPGKYGFKPIQFGGKTVYGMNEAPTLIWHEDAERRLNHVPAFVRGQVRQRVEDYAREHQIETITPELMHTVREQTIGSRSGTMPSFLRKMFSKEDSQ